MSVVLIDGDILIYKIPQDCTDEFTIEKTQEDEDSIYRTIAWGSKSAVKRYIDRKIKSIKEKTGCKDAVICLSSVNNFRKKINPSYKIKRRAIKPVVFDFVRNYFKEKYSTFERDNLEADDLMGILATFEGNIKGIPQGERVIWSLDKDFKTVPCTFFKENVKGVIKKLWIDEKTADYNFMFQTLTGDPVDCYSGCKGIGTKQAMKILDDTDGALLSMWEKVKETYIKKGQTYDDALLNARCARILRAQDYDFKSKSVLLWEMQGKEF